MRILTAEHKGNPVEVNIAEQTDDMLQDLGEAGRGRFAFVAGHVSGTVGKKKCEQVCVSNRWFLSRVRYDRYVERMIAAVEAVEVTDIAANTSDSQHAKIEAYCEKHDLDEGDFFEAQRETVLSRLRKEDASTAGQREGQAVNTVQANGWTLTLQTVTDPDSKLKRPTTDAQGRMTVASIKLPFFEISKMDAPTAEYPGLQPGIYGKTNSRADTIMRNAIERVARDAGGIRQYKTFSLQAGKYQHISMDGHTILGMVRDSQTAELDAKVADFIRYVGELDAAPLVALMAEATAAATVAR